MNGGTVWVENARIYKEIYYKYIRKIYLSNGRCKQRNKNTKQNIAWDNSVNLGCLGYTAIVKYGINTGLIYESNVLQWDKSNITL